MRLNINKALEYVVAENLTLYQHSKTIKAGICTAKSIFYEFFKRFIDVGFAMSCIIIFLPFWLLLIILIKITSKGPVFYTSEVTGKNQQTFVIFKFRTMYNKSSSKMNKLLVEDMIKNNKPTEKLKHDSRITKLGKFLRKFSIDEFPQLINVLNGDMSLVGPRPCLPYEFDIMSDWHKQRFAVKPGITGLWQVTGRNKIRFNEQIALDLLYIENRSMYLDLQIMFHTVPVVVLGL